MSDHFKIKRTAQGRYLTFDPLGRHISGTANNTLAEAYAEITGYVSGWNASIDRRPILCWSSHTVDEQEEAA